MDRGLRLRVVDGRVHVPRRLLLLLLLLLGHVRIGRSLHGLVGEAESSVMVIHILILHLNVLVAHRANAAGAGVVRGEHRGRHAGRDVARAVAVSVGRRGRAGDVGRHGHGVGPRFTVVGERNVLAIFGERAVVARGERRCPGTGDGAAAGAEAIIIDWCGVGRRGHRDAHVLLQPRQLILEGLVASQQLLDGLVAALLALEVLQLALQPLNVLLGPGPDGPLRLSVVGPLACEL